MATQSAITTQSFVSTLGVNTHIDFAAYGYQNLVTVENAIKYLGLTNIRDSAETASDATTWQQVAQATGAKFDDYIAETSPAGMTTDLGFVNQLAQEGILNYLEGGNEEDDAYPASLGNTLQITAQFQQQVYATGHSLGLPVINMSFGSGWTADNNWQGDYGTVGDLSAYCDYGNAHTYPGVGQTPGYTIDYINGLAQLAAASRPVITTEIGWDENAGFTQTQIAGYVLDAALDGIKYGDVKTYYYGLFNDGSGNFGLMNSDGTAKPAGLALHDLTTLLADNGTSAATFSPSSLTYTLSTSDDTVLMQKSDGSFWLAVWNENAASHSATITLGANATQFTLFDPETGTSAVKTASNISSFTFTVPDHPVLVEITGAASGGGSSGSGSGSGSTGGTSPSPDPVLTVPSSETVASGATLAITGVSVADPWAAANPGTLALNVTATVGTIAMKDASGKLVAGSGTDAISVSGTLAQINAELATLSYTAGNSSGSITVDVWDQAGAEGTKAFGVTVTSPTPNPVLTVPGAEKVAACATLAITGVSVSDPWAAGNPGTLALNVTASAGSVTMKNASGNLLAGSGTGAIHVSGTLAQINAELATLSYTAANSNGSVTVDVWDQAGVEATKAIGVTVTPTGTGSTITLTSSQTDVVESVNNATIIATSGNHMIFIAGTSDVVTATGGTESIQAYQGGNRITTGAGNDTIRFAGSNNVIDAGAGTNSLADSGSNNTILLHGAGSYDDISGYVLANSDKLDLRPMLATTGWTGDAASIGNYIKLASSGANALIRLDPSGVAGGATYTVATLEGSGAVSLQTLLAHSIT